MTTDPSSILVDGGVAVGPLVASLALELVRNARNSGLTLDETRTIPPKVPTFSILADTDKVDEEMVSVIPKSTSQSATASLGQALAAASSAVSRPRRLTPMSVRNSPTVTGFKPSRSGSVTVEPSASAPVPQQQLQPPTAPQPRTGTVELESIIPSLSRPPTLLLSRSSLSSPSFRPSIHHVAATRFIRDNDKPPLTDRYGFIYDVSSYNVKLLVKAKEASSPAPASLTGVKVEDVENEEDWPQAGGRGPSKTDLKVIPGHCDACEVDGIHSHSAVKNLGEKNDRRGDTLLEPSSENLKTSAASVQSGRSRSLKLDRALSPSKSSVSAAAVTSGQGEPIDSPPHACDTTMALLLSQLTEIHDKQQDAQKAEWDAFLKKRRIKESKAIVASSSNAGTASALGGAAALLGLGLSVEDEEVTHTKGMIGVAQMGLSANKEDFKEFSRLIRKGAPLVYRPKVWLECSGALEMMEPGLFQELLARNNGEKTVALREIDKDVSRTMPLNVFFGGDGAGVNKLRRVLQAYSWLVIELFPSLACLNINPKGATQTSGTVRLVPRYSYSISWPVSNFYVTRVGDESHWVDSASCIR